LSIASSTFGSNNTFKVISHGRYDGYYPNVVSKAEARFFLKIPNDAKVALFLGSMGGYKGVHWLLQSAEELAHRNIFLLLAGDTSGLGESDRDLLRRASQKNVILHEGFVPESQMQYFLNSADCLVLPYLESFTSGMAFLGLSFRLPIVGTSATAFKEIIDFKLCLPCDPNDPTSVSGAIEKVCSWDRAQFEERCDDFLATCGWDEIADQHLALYGLCTHHGEQGPQRIQPEHPSEAD
jgi:glycosyltransferase involved in cell wall biosynthesis